MIRKTTLESHEVLEKMKEFVSNPQVKLLHKVYAYGWSYVFVFQSCMDWRLGIASPCFRGNCQVVFRTGQTQLCQSDFHISNREVTARKNRSRNLVRNQQMEIEC